MSSPYTAAPQEGLAADIDVMQRRLSAEDPEIRMKAYEEFIGSLVNIEYYINLSDEQREVKYNELFNTQSDGAMYRNQILFCTMASLSRAQLELLKSGVLNAISREKGFESLYNQESLCRSIASRIILILNAGNGPYSPEYRIAAEFGHKHSSLFALQFLSINDPTSLERCVGLLMTLKISGILNIITSLNIAEQDLARVNAEG